MGKGREICDVLKAIRKKIADTNGISYEPSECHFTGDCQGTCPKCESELAMLDSAIEEKRQNGDPINLCSIASNLANNHYPDERFAENKDKQFHVYLLVDGSESEHTAIYNSLICQLLEAIKGIISDNHEIKAIVECYDVSKGNDWVIIDMENHEHLLLQSGGEPNLKKGFYELRCELNQSKPFDYAPLIVLMSNGESIEDSRLELIKLNDDPFYKSGLKIAFKSTTTSINDDILKRFTQSEEAILLPGMGTMLKGIIRLIPLDYVIPSGNLQLYEGDISLPSDVEGIPFGNYGNDDWNQF